MFYIYSEGEKKHKNINWLDILVFARAYFQTGVWKRVLWSNKKAKLKFFKLNNETSQ